MGCNFGIEIAAPQNAPTGQREQAVRQSQGEKVDHRRRHSAAELTRR